MGHYLTDLDPEYVINEDLGTGEFTMEFWWYSNRSEEKNNSIEEEFFSHRYGEN